MKTDHEGKSIAGVKFTREGERSCVLCEFVSSEDGVVHVTGQMPVAYVIREIERWKASQEPTN